MENNLQQKIYRGIVFIGMSGSGKTTIGKHLAPLINYRFIDSDHLIEKRFGNLPLQSIVDSYKDKKEFLALESEVIQSIVLEKSILATGGSTCYSGEALRELGGVIVFLRISWEALIERLGTFSERGVIILHKDVQEEYLARQDMYMDLADIIIDCSYKSETRVVQEIRERLKV